MIKGSTIPELWTQLMDQQKEKYDYTTLANAVGFQISPDDGEIELVGKNGVHRPTPWFHTQLANFLQIPIAYYRKCLEKDPVLTVVNANRWLAASDKGRLIRTVGPTARAFLSDRYHIRDNALVFQALLKALKKLKDEDPGFEFTVQSSNLSEDYMHIKLTFPSLAKEVPVAQPNNHTFVNQVIEPGVNMRNGEIGNSQTQLNVTAMVLACLNGLMMEKVHSSRHVGGRLDHDEEIRYEMDTMKADDNLFVLALRDNISHALNEALWLDRIETFSQASQRTFKAQPAEVLEAASKRFLMTEAETHGIMNQLFREGHMTQWGLAQAITHQAHELKDITYDRSTELEAIGGNIITLGAQEWNQVALAEAA